jgi:hypothetical protein
VLWFDHSHAAALRSPTMPDGMPITMMAKGPATIGLKLWPFAGHSHIGILQYGSFGCSRDLPAYPVA